MDNCNYWDRDGEFSGDDIVTDAVCLLFSDDKAFEARLQYFQVSLNIDNLRRYIWGQNSERKRQEEAQIRHISQYTTPDK